MKGYNDDFVILGVICDNAELQSHHANVHTMIFCTSIYELTLWCISILNVFAIYHHIKVSFPLFLLLGI